MPSYLRTFYIQQLVKAKETEKKEMEKIKKKPGMSKPSSFSKSPPKL
tara:strand:- start:355 stop:495 length:141 start_codon:yes stop_codon:yes gene_type:complete